MNESIAEMKASIFTALGHTNRIRILEFLRNGEQCVCEIHPELGLEQSNLSRHLKALSQAGLVQSRRQGVSIYYRIADPRVFEVIDAAAHIVKDSLLQDAQLAHEI